MIAILIAVLVVALVVPLIRDSRYRAIGIHYPSFYFALGTIFYLYIGAATFEYGIKPFLERYDVMLSPVLLHGTLALLAFVVANKLVARLAAPRSNHGFQNTQNIDGCSFLAQWSSHRLFAALLVTTIVGVVGFGIRVYALSAIPLLHSDATIKATYVPGLGYAVILQGALVFVPTIAYLLWRKGLGHPFIAVLVSMSAMVAITAMALTGSRWLILIAMLEVILLHALLTLRLSIASAWRALPPLLVAWGTLGYVRASSESIADTFGGAVRWQLIGNAYPTLLNYIDAWEVRHSYPEHLLLSKNVFGAFPGSIWSLFGVDKQAKVDAVAHGTVLGQEGLTAGIAIGTYGESMLMFGVAGTVFFYAILGCILALLDTLCVRWVKHSSWAMVAVPLLSGSVGFAALYNVFNVPLQILYFGAIGLIALVAARESAQYRSEHARA